MQLAKGCMNDFNSLIMLEIVSFIPEINGLVLKKPVTVKLPVFVSSVKLDEFLSNKLTVSILTLNCVSHNMLPSLNTVIKCFFLVSNYLIPSIHKLCYSI